MNKKSKKSKKSKVIIGGIFALVALLAVVAVIFFSWQKINKNNEEKYLNQVVGKEITKRNNPGPILEILNNVIVSHPFTLGSSANVSLLVISSDNQAHKIVFSDPSVVEKEIDVAPSEIKLLVLKDLKPGNYVLNCIIPGHKEKGEKAEMIIKESPAEAKIELSDEDKNAPKIMSELALTINNKTISPNTFLLAPALPTFLKFISADNQEHNIVFEAPELKDANLNIEAGKSNGVVLNIPVPGEYKFHCATPGHKKENGKMIVK